MRRIVIYPYIAWLCLALHWGCDQQNPIMGELELTTDSLQTELRVVVLQKADNIPVEGASISLIGSQACTTNEEGIALFNGIQRGKYLCKVRRTGYAPIAKELCVDWGGALPGATTGNAYTEVIKIAREGVTIQGTAAYDENGVIKAAASANIELSLPEQFEVKSLSATTDSFGQFAFHRLPERTPIEIKYREYRVGSNTFGNDSIIELSPRFLGDTVKLKTSFNRLSSVHNTADLLIRVENRIGRTPERGVLVNLLTVDSMITGESGIAQFSGIPSGQYEYELSKSGFAKMKGIVVAPQSGGRSLLHLSITEAGCCESGRLLAQNPRKYGIQKAEPVEKANVRLVLADTAFAQREFQCSTDANGTFLFCGLPQGADYDLLVDRFQKNHYQYGKPDSEPAKLRRTGCSGDTSFSEALVLYPLGEPLTVVKHNGDSLGRTDPLTIEFSRPVDTLLFRRDRCVDLLHKTHVLLPQITWKAGGRIMEIIPARGDWDPHRRYSLRYRKTIYGQNGMPLRHEDFGRIDLNFGLSNLDSTRIVTCYAAITSSGDTSFIDSKTRYVKLVWNSRPGAQSYAVYEISTHVPFWSISGTNTTSSSNTSDTSMTLTYNSLNRPFENGDSVAYLVIARNGNGETDLKTCTPYIAKDVTRPRIFADYYAKNWKGFRNSSSPVKATLVDSLRLMYLPRNSYGTSYAAEKLDTTSSPVLSVKEGGYSSNGDTTYVLPQDSLSWTWSSPTMGFLRACVPAGANAAYDTLVADFSNVRDLAGNAVSLDEGSGIIKVNLKN